MAAAIDYYFNCASPYSYLGHRRLREIAGRHGATVRLKPVDIGRIFAVSGGVPLARRAAQRQAYRLVELRRWSEYLGMPLTLQPKYFPVDDAQAARAIIAADPEGTGAVAWDLTEAMMRAVWVEDRDIADRETVASIAGALGLDGTALLAEADRPEIAARRDACTEEAIGRQIFGLPTYVLDGELFWGQDRLDFLDRRLGG